MKPFYCVYLLLIFMFSPAVNALDSQSYQNRVDEILTQSLVSPNHDNMLALSYQGIENSAMVEAMIANIQTAGIPDFGLIKLIRILLNSDQYDDRILTGIEHFPYWISQGEKKYQYWSENHMIMWMSSEWLLHEHFGRAPTPTLAQRLRHYLDLKVAHGFYEFNSPVYYKFTLAGLLNLADFAIDSEIKAKAELAAQKLLKQFLLFTTEAGTFAPTAGRGYTEHYRNPGNHGLIYLLTGIGSVPQNPGMDVSFLATSALDMTPVLDSWQPQFSGQFVNGHSLGESFSLNSRLNREDRTVFQWSMGGYFAPSVAEDTLWTINHYDLSQHEAFKNFAGIPNALQWFADTAATIGATFSRSSVLTGTKLNVFKHAGSALSSMDNYWGGYYGYQQWPIIAVADDVAVWPLSGNVDDWQTYRPYTANTHLPKVFQQDNLALILYWPNTEISLANTFGLGEISTKVNVYWPESEFDEWQQEGRWLVGRKGNSYVAMFRDCTDKNNGIYSCKGDRGRQMWGSYVGNVQTHGSYSAFVDVIRASSYKESYTWNWKEWQFQYYGRISVGDKSLSYTWK
ncbi:hypothetical protein [uncultured Shewanella sp.]|uniref:hypothetical protein n=1 Tax=uncultured Shewanella sp. TaxID=173975 RepID=UPI002634C686|nr:hypothetical protein [uncultured Shewanella sp.]